MANSVNYEDERFKQVETDRQEALTDAENTYGNMIGESDKHYQAQIDASKEWADKQSQLQQEQTDFTIEQIQQQKDQVKKDYAKEQSGAFVDWQKQSNQYGANAEEMAAGGMTNTGYSESSQVGMYNTYQNRVATAREAYTQAVLSYDNAMKDARLQNNAALAEIAFQSLQQQLELSLEGFQYKNQLILEQANKKTELDNIYHNRYLEVLNQINTENALAEQVRQYNENMAMQQKEYEEGVRQFNEEIARLKELDAQEYALEIQQLELQKAQLEEEKRQFDVKNGVQKTNTSTPAVTQPKTVPAEEYEENPADVDVDYQSIADLGYGDISMDELARLVAAGDITYTEVNGKLVFKKVVRAGTLKTGGANKAIEKVRYELY